MKNNFDYLDKTDKASPKKFIPIFIVAVIVIILTVILIFQFKDDASNKNTKKTIAEPTTTSNNNDPEFSSDVLSEAETGMNVDISSLLSTGDENSETTYGIDVSSYQGTIDWSQVASAGIDFAMIRVGYRTQSDGKICEDTNAKYNMQEAIANGLKIGVYFFSTATSNLEAEEEAAWVADYISKYQITYPVAYDSEGFNNPDSRQNTLSISDRTDIAIAFMSKIYDRGYTPMFYAASAELLNNNQWITSSIQTTYKIWVAQYPGTAASVSSYNGTHSMWQYTNRGNISGINTTVDINIAYFGYNSSTDSQNNETAELATANPEALMKFTDVQETVTAKESANLRDIPSQDTDSNILLSLTNGDTATRTGVSDSGWSRLEYDGKVCYAVSSYLTTDLSYNAPSQDGSGSGDGLQTKFTDVNESVTAKIEVNLRLLPSVTNPDATIAATIKNGEVITRTGVNTDFGWSRVEYNGQTLYCVSSYLQTLS